MAYAPNEDQEVLIEFLNGVEGNFTHSVQHLEGIPYVVITTEYGDAYIDCFMNLMDIETLEGNCDADTTMNTLAAAGRLRLAGIPTKHAYRCEETDRQVWQVF